MARGSDNACLPRALPSAVLGHYVYGVGDTRQVLLLLLDRGYLRPQVGGLGGLRRRKRQKGGGPAAAQRDQPAVVTQAAGTVLGQLRTDEIGDAVEQDARSGHHAVSRPPEGKQ